ncbi:MAG: PTS sugar transporter subunit IIA [Eubacteriales bacterium]|nr:PTS sugar transporter subunit IIA [Eubacteriales bacterium]
MNRNQKELLKYLSCQTKPQSSTALANALNISARSVKSYVGDLNKLYGKKIILSSHNGYELNPVINLNLIMEDDEEQIPQTMEERAFYIIRQLILCHTSRLDLFELCEYLCVSYSTVKSVISMMNRMFATYQVKFVCENDCVLVVADELNKRRLISYVINEESKNSFIDTVQLQKCFADIDMEQLRLLIQQTTKRHSFYLNDFAAANLLLHFAIIIDREQNGNHLENLFTDYQPDNAMEYDLIEDFCSQLEQMFRFSLNQSARAEIYTLFKANVNYSIPASQKELERIIGPDILHLTRSYVEQVNSLYLIDLSDTAFTTAFSLHLKNLLFRASHGRCNPNPMTDVIRMNNPIIYDIAIYLGIDLMERYHIQIMEDEMAFLAMHIGAEIERQNTNGSKVPCALLCPDYRNLSSDLSNRLLLNFSNQIDIVCSVNSEEDLKDRQFSILFTTLPVHRTYPGHVVQISPFDLSSQYEQIEDAIIAEQDWHNNHILKKNFDFFFEEDLFLANPPMTSKNQIITKLCDTLLLKKYVDSTFEEKVYRRENAASTAFGHIAIPHSIEMDAIKTSVAVAVSHKGFIWDNNTVHLVLLISINRADKKTFRELYESLIMLFHEDKMVQEIRSCTSFQDFRDFIYTHIGS